MKRLKLRRSLARTVRRSPLVAGLAAIALLAFTPGDAWAVEPATVFGLGTTGNIVSGVGTLDNQVWWAVQDLHSPAKVFVSFNTTPALGIQSPAMILLGVLPTGAWYSYAIPTSFTTSSNPPSITSSVASVAWVPSSQKFHLTVSDYPTLTADLWFTGHTGGATLPAIWDGETSNWTQSVGNASVSGSVKFPGYSLPTTVTNWGGEQETQYGNYELGPGAPPAPANHIGYDYATSANPDGSADTLYMFPELDGVWRGILTHNSPTGQVTECEPPTVTLSNWFADPGGFHYPLSVSAACGSLSFTWTTTPIQTEVAYSFSSVDGFVATNSAGHSSVSGSVAFMQHIRDNGYWGQTP